MTRKEDIELQIGACKARLKAIIDKHDNIKIKLHESDNNETAIMFGSALFNAETLFHSCKAELSYWQSKLKEIE